VVIGVARGRRSGCRARHAASQQLAAISGDHGVLFRASLERLRAEH